MNFCDNYNYNYNTRMTKGWNEKDIKDGCIIFQGTEKNFEKSHSS